jgi:hypothetical protein
MVSKALANDDKACTDASEAEEDEDDEFKDEEFHDQTSAVRPLRK